LLGFLTGAVIYGLTYTKVFPQISKLADYGSTTFAALWNLNVWLVIALFVLMSLLLFYLIDRAGLQRKDKLEG
jgi:nitrogen fixation/metabolism regulation signal transduction histidine kinase